MALAAYPRRKPSGDILGGTLEDYPRGMSSHDNFGGCYQEKPSGNILGGYARDFPRGIFSKDFLRGNSRGMSSRAILEGYPRGITLGIPLGDILGSCFGRGSSGDILGTSNGGISARRLEPAPPLQHTVWLQIFAEAKNVASQYIGTRGLAASPSNAAEKL